MATIFEVNEQMELWDMNNKLERFKKTVFGKRVVLLGVGITNKPLVRQLLSYGAEVIGCDINKDLEKSFLEEMKMGAKFRLGPDYLDNLDCDIVFKSPGIREDLPWLSEAKRSGITVTSEMEMFFKTCPCKIIAVTGSDGKTTTTTLIHNILSEDGNICHLGGNIGKPLLPEVELMNTGDYAIVELSSFQLMSMTKSPDVAVVTNISPNHLDVHKSMEEYIEAKKNIFKFQNKSDTLVLNSENEITASFAREANAEVVLFGGKNANVRLEDDVIYYDDKAIITKEDIALPGQHNVENYMAAIAAVGKRVSVSSIKRVANNFLGVEHRIEFVREVDGVRFYNDSIASSPTRAKAGLYAFDKKVILIAGGYDKKIPFDEFGHDIKERVRRLYLIGETAGAIKDAVVAAYDGGRTLPIITQYNTLEAVVKEAYMAAEAGDIVLLSPACASFDMYKNFEQRGQRFKEIVRRL